jgi:hypothetical protein
LLARSQGVAETIASLRGLIWKIWLLRQEEFAMGGMYLFATREAAEAYLNHPIFLAIGSNPAVVSTEFRLWEVDVFLSAITRGPLQASQPDALMAGGR